jgi:hypothetical protein
VDADPGATLTRLTQLDHGFGNFAPARVREDPERNEIDRASGKFRLSFWAEAAPIPWRATQAEAALTGQMIDKAVAHRWAGPATRSKRC